MRWPPSTRRWRATTRPGRSRPTCSPGWCGPGSWWSARPCSRTSGPTTTSAPSGRTPIPPLQDPEKLAALLYTSGTSGRPRAAMLTHRALLANIDQVASVDPPMIHGDDVVLAVLPMFHVYGLNAVLGVALHHRAKIVLAARFDPQGTLDLIEDEACSVIPVAPPVFAYWRDIDGLRERLGPGAAHALGLGAPVAGADRGVHRAHRDPDPPGLRPDRGLAGRHQHAGQRDAAERLGRRGAARRRDPAGRRVRPGARGRGPGRDLDPRRQPVQRLLARRLRRSRTPRAGGPPATSASSTRAATCSWSTGSRSW